MIHFVREGTKAWIKDDVPPDLDEHLTDYFAQVNPDDLTDVLYFYENGCMYPGVVEKAMEQARIVFGHKCFLFDLCPDTGGGAFTSWMFLGKYWPLQGEAVEAMVAAGFGALVSPARSGKTVIMAGIVTAIKKRALIVTYNQEPFNQVCKSFGKFTNIPELGRVGEGVFEFADVTVATAQSLYAYLKRDPMAQEEFGQWLRKCEVLIVDEAHHASSLGTYELYEYMQGIHHAFAITATYRRDDDEQELLYAMFGQEPVHTITHGDTTEAGTTCPVTILTQPVPRMVYYYTVKRDNEEQWEFERRRALTTQYHKRAQYQKVYKDYVVEGATGRNYQVAEAVQSYRSEGRTGVVIVKLIEHAHVLHRLIPDCHILVSSGPSKATKKQRQELLDKLQHREVDCLVSTVFDEAVDVPSLDVVIIAAGGKSTVKAEQRIRSTTMFSGELRTGHYEKEEAFVYLPMDQADFLTSHSKVTAKVLKEIVAQHPANQFVELEEWQPGSLL